MIEIDVPTLFRATAAVCSHLQEIGISKLQIEHDFFWELPEEKRYDMESKPSDFEVGQLSDNLLSVERIANGSAEPIAFALCWIAPILRAVGERVVR